MNIARNLTAQKEPVDTRTEDEVYGQARVIAMQAGKVSASFLQRRLKIGYARAARLLDLMEEDGIIGPATTNGAGPRDVIIRDLNHKESKTLN